MSLRPVLAAACMMAALPAAGQWLGSGVPVASGPLDQGWPLAVSDGRGGAIVLYLSGSSQYSIGWTGRLQRLSSEGARLWGEEGVSLGAMALFNGSRSIIPDGASGCIVGTSVEYLVDSSQYYSDTRYRAVLQRVSSTGERLWGPAGTVLSMHGGVPLLSPMPGSSGELIAIWPDGGGLRAQRVDELGRTLWAPGGVLVCVRKPRLWSLAAAEDGAGGVIAAWCDTRWSEKGVPFAQRIGGHGEPLWRVDGLPLTSDTVVVTGTAAVSDGRGGAILCWQVYPGAGVTRNIRGQRVDPAGTLLWGEQGIALTAGPGDHTPFLFSADGAGGAILLWENQRRDTANFPAALFAQRFDGQGRPLWTEGGVQVAPERPSWYPAAADRDGKGDVVAVWYDPVEGGLHAQRIDTLGSLAWPSGGLLVSAALGQNMALAGRPQGGAVVFWSEQRDSMGYDLYARLLEGPVSAAGPERAGGAAGPGFALRQNYPNPFNPETVIPFSLGEPSVVTLAVYNVLGEEVARLLPGTRLEAGRHTARFSGGGLPSGVYFCRLQTTPARSAGRAWSGVTRMLLVR